MFPGYLARGVQHGSCDRGGTPSSAVTTLHKTEARQSDAALVAGNAVIYIVLF